MYVCIYVCMYIYVYIYVCVYIYIYVCVCMYIWAYFTDNGHEERGINDENLKLIQIHGDLKY